MKPPYWNSGSGMYPAKLDANGQWWTLRKRRPTKAGSQTQAWVKVVLEGEPEIGRWYQAVGFRGDARVSNLRITEKRYRHATADGITGKLVLEQTAERKTETGWEVEPRWP